MQINLNLKEFEDVKILDMTSGNRAIWFNKKHPLATYIDIRESVEPDFVMDSTNMSMFSAHTFNLIVFDPPHLNTGKNSNMAKQYGHFTTKEILATIEGCGREAHRVSKPNALMAFKWNDHDIKLDRALKLMADCWHPLFGQHLKNRVGSDSKSQSFWVMLLRKDLKGLKDER